MPARVFQPTWLMLVILVIGGCGRRWSPADSQTREHVEGGRRIIDANGLPNHATGRFPNRNDPFGVRPQTYHFHMPAEPVEADALTRVGFWRFGIAVNGVPFDPAGPNWRGDPATGWQFEVMSTTARPFLGLDENNAHVQPGGGYHYHGLPVGLVRQLEARTGGSRMLLLGRAADGFPIYGPVGFEDPDDAKSSPRPMRSSYRLKAGSRPGGPGGTHDGTFVEDYEYVAGLGDLDECNGRRGVTPEYPKGIYHYHVTETFPFIPRWFRGRPDRSFKHPGPGPGKGGLPPALAEYQGK